MAGFSLNRVPGIAVGAGRAAGLGGDVTSHAGEASTVLLVADPGLAAIGVTDTVEAGLTSGGQRVVRFEDFTSDPQERQVAAGARAAEESGAALVVGLGGGSALDAAKMIAAMAGSPRPVEAFRMAAAPLPDRGVRLFCLPTTAGTGSETTSVSILSDADHRKVWFWGETLKPDLVVLDPMLTVGLPPALTAATGLDALVHAIEAATNKNASPGSDLYAFAAIAMALEFLPRAVSRPDDLEARERMLLSAAFAGIAIDNAGTALAHNIGHALGSLMPIHHGRAVAIGMAASLPWVIEGNRAAFDRVAAAFGLDSADALPERFGALIDELKIDRSLPQELDAATLSARMAAPENAAMLLSTARAASPADLDNLAAAVIAQTTQSSEAA